MTLAAFVLDVLIALFVYLVPDLDSSRHGAIHVSQESMLGLEPVIGAAPGEGASHAVGNP